MFWLALHTLHPQLYCKSSVQILETPLREKTVHTLGCFFFIKDDKKINIKKQLPKKKKTGGCIMNKPTLLSSAPTIVLAPSPSSPG